MACVLSAELRRAMPAATFLLIGTLSVSCSSRDEPQDALRSVSPTKRGPDAVAATGVTIGEASVLRVARTKPYPGYPPAALAENREGRVIVRIATTADGTPRDVSILESTGKDFTESVREAVEQWRLSPLSAHSRESPPSPVAATLTFYFKITDGTGTVATGSEIAARLRPQ